MGRAASLIAASFAGALGIASTAAGAADPAVNLAGSGAQFTGDCRGHDASLAGSDNTVTIRGACQAVQIAGDGNRVLIDLAPGGTIKIYGSNNEVSWTSPGAAEIVTVGPGNIVTRAR